METKLVICDCLSKNRPRSHLPVFRELLNLKFNLEKPVLSDIGLDHLA